MRIAGIALIGIFFLSIFLLPTSLGAGGFMFFMLCMMGGIVLIILSLPQVRAARGTLVMGKILEIRQCGFLYNWNVQGGSILNLTMQFRADDGQQVTASGKAPVSWEDQTWVQPGTLLPLRYYPKNPKYIAITMQEKSEKLDPLITAYREKMENGPLVFGTLVSMKPTGGHMEGNSLGELFLRFTTVEGQQVTASSIRLFPDEPFQPGAVFPLRYNPEYPEQIITGLDLSEVDEKSMHRALGAYMLANGWTTQKILDIEEHGVKAVGVILSAQPTGNIANGCEEMALHVKVTRPEDGGTYDATVKQPIRSDSLSSVQPGSVVDVFHMPEDEENIAVSYKVSMTFGL